jgi:hypothetical protein
MTIFYNRNFFLSNLFPQVIPFIWPLMQPPIWVSSIYFFLFPQTPYYLYLHFIFQHSAYLTLIPTPPTITHMCYYSLPLLMQLPSASPHLSLHPNCSFSGAFCSEDSCLGVHCFCPLYFNNIRLDILHKLFDKFLKISTIFWDITPCSPLKFNWRFGGPYRLHLPGKYKLIKKPGWKQVANRALLWDDIILRNVSWLSTDYTALYPRNNTLHNQRCKNFNSYIRKIY